MKTSIILTFSFIWLLVFSCAKTDQDHHHPRSFEIEWTPEEAFLQKNMGILRVSLRKD